MGCRMRSTACSRSSTCRRNHCCRGAGGAEPPLYDSRCGGSSQSSRRNGQATWPRAISSVQVGLATTTDVSIGRNANGMSACESHRHTRGLLSPRGACPSDRSQQHRRSGGLSAGITYAFSHLRPSVGGASRASRARQRDKRLMTIPLVWFRCCIQRPSPKTPTRQTKAAAMHRLAV
jgi:hypothetical protein